MQKVEDETIRYVEQFVKDTLKAMDMDVEITSSIDKDGALYVDMKGENMGILIGKRGQTLDSLQYLVKPRCKQTSVRLCKSETRYRKLSCKKRRDIKTSCEKILHIR